MSQMTSDSALPFYFPGSFGTVTRLQVRWLRIWGLIAGFFVSSQTCPDEFWGISASCSMDTVAVSSEVKWQSGEVPRLRMHGTLPVPLYSFIAWCWQNRRDSFTFKSCLCLGIPRGLFQSGFLSNILYKYLILLICHMFKCQVFLTILIINVWQRVWILKLLMQFFFVLDVFCEDIHTIKNNIALLTHNNNIKHHIHSLTCPLSGITL